MTACRDFGATSFTAREVLKKVEGRYEIEAKNPYTAVLGVLKKLVEREFLSVAERTGRNPHEYSNRSDRH